MMEFDRVKTQRRSDVNQTLLRGLESESAKLNARLKLLQGEIEGARKAIAQKEHQIQEAERQAQQMREKLDYLTKQTSELRDDQQAWRAAG
jgi:predicted  nucleic acid-binding Zn-ribbon protein